MIKIMIAKDFSKTPFGRYVTDSPNSAERFRKEILAPAFRGQEQPVEVDFSDISLGVGSSFLEEAFGGLVRKGKFSKDFLQKVLVIRSPRRPIIKDRIETYIKEA